MKQKRLLVMAVAAMLSAGLWSCEKDDNTNETGSSTTQVDPGTNPGTVWVDLGLPSGLLWAAHNVGASAPEDYGDRFAWGETESKEVYDWSTYRYSNGGSYQLTKYCYDSDYGYNGFTDNLTILQPGDDAATANWGDGARTPTIEEWQELMDNTTSEWTTLGGVNGRRFTAANGNSIFLPAAGRNGVYWSSSLGTDRPYDAWFFCFDSGSQYVDYGGSRGSGFSVRPVRSSLK